MSAYWIDYGFSFVHSAAQFRTPLALQIVFALITLAIIQFCPESPRWLLKHGREAESRAVLAQLSANYTATREEALEHEFALIKETLSEEEAAAIKDKNGNPMTPMRACFTMGKDRYFHRVMLGVGSQFMQQLSGINLITYCELTGDSVGKKH